MGNYASFQMFENPRRGKQARNFTTNVPKILDLKSSSKQICSVDVGCPWFQLTHNLSPLKIVGILGVLLKCFCQFDNEQYPLPAVGHWSVSNQTWPYPMKWWACCPGQVTCNTKDYFADDYIICISPLHFVTESKRVLDSGLLALDSGFQLLDSSLCQWDMVLDFNRQWDSGFFGLYSVLQSLGFWIPQAKFS